MLCRPLVNRSSFAPAEARCQGMSEYDHLIELYRVATGMSPSPQIRRKLKDNARLAERLDPMFQRICEYFNADHRIKQSYAWELTLAIHEKNWGKVAVLRYVLQRLKSEKLA